MLTASKADRMIREGVAALQRGDAPTALRLFHAAKDTPGVPQPHILIARACHMLGDEAGEESALDLVLAERPRDVRALLMKGERRAGQGDDRAATAFYKIALASARASGPPPAGLVADLRRAESYLAGAMERYQAHLAEQLAGAGFSPTWQAPRVRQALDILLGKRGVYLQQPNSFYFPGLPNIEFYERSDFPWLATLEAAAPAIRAELEAVIHADGAFPPYVEAHPDRPPPPNPLLNDPSWGAFYLWRGGAPVADNAARCPVTMAALEAAPLPRIDGRSPMALFSLLKPGTHIRPHHGLLNTRLICHIPIITAPDCALRVGAETREWRDGEALVFDDSIEHEAWNRGDRTRVVLLFEIWRPELSGEERSALTALFEAISVYDTTE
ncbi:aspartyl/asparaginyl beta-hydroxylase domain-containing protein [Sphingomonas flavalba]|uniref:aspartyl/asparaginyl beta-hydroxylase domain-containing protein n=1 Tax=Sphingomonas flavalba TaxID=2559804 RepID=UPI00109DE007|nr:aspartyl/asparaginyl beta-hydroxylase domain-containing protein [Sphingomonas flavalba]